VRLRSLIDGVIVDDPPRGRWVSLLAALERTGNIDAALVVAASDLLAFLAGASELRDAVGELLEAVRGDASVAADPAAAGIPFRPRSMRAFMVWDSHYTASARMLVKRFFPRPLAAVAGGYERLTRQTFPPFKPKQRFYRTPSFYMANHAAVLADGEPMWWPSHTSHLDFELELACVLAHPIADATPAEASAAVGGWFVLNDWSARDVQADDARNNPFGPVVKSKTFANSIGCDVLAAWAIGDWRTTTGRVRVDGEVWCEGTTAGAAHDVGDMLAYASAGERLEAGDVVSTGTMPGCCGLELDRWIKPGQTVELEIDGIGTVANTIEGSTPRRF
jgi:2-keto-4-pentenoate hydratase/2-oxohepta-3-ene-1,7-dioic acid hydratase in catechol pathway